MTVVCIATGPSLTPADVEYVKGKATVIVVNDAHRLAPWADVLYSSDRFWWLQYQGMPNFAGRKASVEHAKGRHLRHYTTWGIRVFENTGYDGLETDPNGIRTCGGNSGGAAVNVAVHLGAKRIVLLGYDMGYGASGKRHFFGDHPKPLANGHNFPTWRKAFQTMREPLEKVGVEVVNCTRTTALEAFPCAPLEAVL